MRRLALLARPPEIGRAKPRLSPALPPAAAAALAGGLLEDAVDAMRAATSPDERFLSWVGSEWTLLGSPPDSTTATDGGALSERLVAAFQSLVQVAGDRGVIVGTDCPSLGAPAIDEAFAKLEAADLVLAPTHGGGLGLIGLSRSAEALFRDVTWTAGRVLAQMEERAGSLGLTHARLEPLDEVETPEDLCRLLAAAVVPGSAIGPGTRLVLGKLGMLPAALTSSP